MCNPMDEKTNLSIVSKWYHDERSFEYMPEGNQKGLKIWEKEVIAEYFGANCSILDVGCGMGREAFVLHDMGFRITGADISEPILEKARQLASETDRKIEFIMTDGLLLPFDGETFDAVIMCFTKDELLTLAEKAGFIGAVCKDGFVYVPENGTILHCVCRKPV